jgi:hypothetical protein
MSAPCLAFTGTSTPCIRHGYGRDWNAATVQGATAGETAPNAEVTGA